MATTEADDSTDVSTALAALRSQVQKRETMGVRAMYEATARRLGASEEQIRNALTSR